MLKLVMLVPVHYDINLNQVLIWLYHHMNCSKREIKKITLLLQRGDP